QLVRDTGEDFRIWAYSLEERPVPDAGSPQEVADRALFFDRATQAFEAGGGLRSVVRSALGLHNEDVSHRITERVAREFGGDFDLAFEIAGSEIPTIERVVRVAADGVRDAAEAGYLAHIEGLEVSQASELDVG